MKLEQKIEKDQVPAEKPSTSAGGADNDIDQRKNAFKGRMTSGSFTQRKSGGTLKKLGTNTSQLSSIASSARTSLQNAVIQDAEQRNDNPAVTNKENTGITIEPAKTNPEKEKEGAPPERKSPMLTKRSPRITGLNLSKLASTPASTTNENESKNGEESTGLVGVSFKDMLLSKKRIQLKSPKKVEPKRDQKQKDSSDSEQSDSSTKNSAPVLPKIKQVSVRKSFFAKALEESQTSFGSNDSGIKTENTQNPADYSRRIDMIISGTPKLAQMFGKADKTEKKTEPLNVGGIVMKAIPRPEATQDSHNTLDSKYVRTSPIIKKLCGGQLDGKNLAFLHPNQQHAHKPIDSGTNTPKRSPKGLKEFLNKKINESEKLKDQISHTEYSFNAGALRAKLLSKLADPNSKITADRIFGEDTFKMFPYQGLSQSATFPIRERHSTPEKIEGAAITDKSITRHNSGELKKSTQQSPESTKKQVRMSPSLSAIRNGLKSMVVPGVSDTKATTVESKASNEVKAGEEKANDKHAEQQPSKEQKTEEQKSELVKPAEPSKALAFNALNTNKKEPETTTKKLSKPSTPTISLRNLAKFDDVARKPEFAPFKQQQPATSESGVRSLESNPLPKSTEAPTEVSTEDTANKTISVSQLSQSNLGDDTLLSQADDSQLKFTAPSKTNVNEAEVDASAKKESTTKGKISFSSLLLISNYLANTTNFKKKFLSKQNSMRVNFEKKENLHPKKDEIKENEMEETLVRSTRLTLTTHWKPKEEIKDEASDDNSPKQNKQQQQHDETFNEDEEGPVVRCYSEGALKKFRTLPNRS